MANLQEKPQWVAGVYQIEKTDLVDGGPDGVSNTQAKQLANRTAWLKAELSKVEQTVSTVDPDYQEALHFEVRRQMELNALAFKEIDKTLNMRIQQGEITLINKGVQSGMAASKSTTATRNLSVTSGRIFQGGRLYPKAAQDNAAAVPPNHGDQPKTCVAYAWLNGDKVSFDVSPLGDEAPSYGVPMYRLTVPAGNTGSTDPNLAQVTMTDIRRIEPYYPTMLDNPSQHLVSLSAPLPTSEWQLALDVVSAVGPSATSDHIQVTARASNGFRLTLAHFADDVRVRYTLTKTGV